MLVVIKMLKGSSEAFLADTVLSETNKHWNYLLIIVIAIANWALNFDNLLYFSFYVHEVH